MAKISVIYFSKNGATAQLAKATKAFGYNQCGLNRLGCQLGVVSEAIQNQINSIDLETAEYLGSRVAYLVQRKNI